MKAKFGERMKKIIHCDADCFYASVEMRDDPRLRGRPIAVGGSPGRRGVISTCNYEARAYGVRSAMASSRAMQLCPDLLILPGRMDVYKEVSQSMRQIFADYSPCVEPLSLDEAYLDVSDSDCQRGSATLIAQEIQTRIAKELGISVSLGAAPTKFLAKVASDWHKPRGIFVIAPEQAQGFIDELPVKKIPGVGKVTETKLHALGLYKCRDLREIGAAQLNRQLGRFGSQLYELASGKDKREVKAERERKSLSVERTFSSDLPTINACEQELPRLAQELARRLRKVDKAYTVAKAFVKLKFSDFAVTSLERDHRAMSIAGYRTMLSEAIKRGQGNHVRLMGIGVRFKVDALAGVQQLDLFKPD